MLESFSMPGPIGPRSAPRHLQNDDREAGLFAKEVPRGPCEVQRDHGSTDELVYFALLIECLVKIQEFLREGFHGLKRAGLLASICWFLWVEVGTIGSTFGSTGDAGGDDDDDIWDDDRRLEEVHIWANQWRCRRRARCRTTAMGSATAWCFWSWPCGSCAPNT